MTVSERFLKYVSFNTRSDEGSESCPSTEKQLLLADALVSELISLGLCAERDENGYVYATLGSNTAVPTPTVGLIAHMDTAPDAPDAPIRPKTVLYEGGDILLNEEERILLSPRDYPALEKYQGEHLIVTDGKTLLGADDKAGIAAIVTAMERLVLSDIPHGDVKVAFTPDEEIGRGADLFDVAKFGADYAYTVDGGEVGELEYENFNAASGKVEFYGVSIHPGSAKDKMKNAALFAAEFISLLPEEERPEHTEGYEGFYHLTHMEGCVEEARVSYIIRDHDRERFEARKKVFLAAADEINRRHGSGAAVATVKDSYYNMKEMILSRMEIIDRAKSAMEKTGMTPRVCPIRGGTDGARLSFMGLPCPNLCTGGVNFHSRFEFVSEESLEKVTSMLVHLLADAVGTKM